MRPILGRSRGVWSWSIGRWSGYLGHVCTLILEFHSDPHDFPVPSRLPSHTVCVTAELENPTLTLPPPPGYLSRTKNPTSVPKFQSITPRNLVLYLYPEPLLLHPVASTTRVLLQLQHQVRLRLMRSNRSTASNRTWLSWGYHDNTQPTQDSGFRLCGGLTAILRPQNTHFILYSFRVFVELPP